ncbi:AAA family ATPase [Pseudarthrobacter sp. N5]|uniref:AAA family ATPase n=1 Tax=Pseudarthrobacter sp. N5 TaxID=3418416 RepID=UPI003CE84608
MRIHRLEISAFGPFAGTEEIDFDRLSAHGLFLLNGATGAGKTSVLDAICFALYGSVPGARQDGKRLRSDHAAAALEPGVTCEFSARGRHFEVSRSPAWEKPSARGKNGFTTQQAHTLLRERVDGMWTEKSGRIDEAGAEITAILGMDREQFTRVVMLPQGDFAAFLRSKATDRLDLLQKLFGTHRFEAVEQELTRQAQNARSDVASLNDQLALMVSRAESEAAPLLLDAAESRRQEGGAALLGWLETAASARVAELVAAAAAAEKASRVSNGRFEAGAARSARQLRLAAAVSRRTAAEAGAPALQLSVSRLERHRKAEVLGGQLQAVDTAETVLVSAARGREDTTRQLRLAVQSEPELAHLDPDTVHISPELGRLRSLQAVVEARLGDEQRLAELRSRVTAVESSRQSFIAASRTHAGALEARLVESEALAAGIQPLEERAAEAVLRTKEAAAADELVDVVRRYGKAVSECAVIAGRHREARDEHLGLRQSWLDLREERLANAAAELAAQLTDGGACPVCGSPDHPAPAPSAASALGMAEAEQVARDSCETAEVALTALELEVTAARQHVAVLAGQGGDTPAEDARKAAAAAHEAAAEAQRAVKELAGCRLRQSELEAEIEAVTSARAAALSGAAQAESTVAEVREQSTTLESALSVLRAGHANLAVRICAITAAAGSLERAEAAQAQCEQAALQAAEARRQLELALPAAGFQTATAAKAGLVGEAEAAALLAEVRAGQDEQARIAELFASEDLRLAAAELHEGSTIDESELETLREEEAQARQTAGEAVLASGLAARSRETLGRISREFEDAATAGRVPREQAELLTALADAACGRGENSYRMSLNSYVLAARLEQVALAASERLVAMSDGRYTLQHTDAKAARGAKSGLGLEVVDQWTGHRRDTSTLSGGESFMASLSLALGLADVVQQEAGGVDIETLFVDEGFGSLDEQALEQVMDALEGLRDGGRVVGLVSHVGEMKQRIGTQLQVVKGRNGSTLHISDGELAG